MTRAPCHPSATVHVHGKNPIRYRCTQCAHTFTGRIGQIHYSSKLSPQTLQNLKKALLTGNSIRGIAIQLHISPSTVDRWKDRLLSA